MENGSAVGRTNLTRKDKKEVPELRSSESVKKSRQKAKQEREMIKELYNGNKNRIEKLESTVEDLAKHLQKQEGAERKEAKEASDLRSDNSNSKKRPVWFGDPF